MYNQLPLHLPSCWNPHHLSRHSAGFSLMSCWPLHQALLKLQEKSHPLHSSLTPGSRHLEFPPLALRLLEQSIQWIRCSWGRELASSAPQSTGRSPMCMWICTHTDLQTHVRQNTVHRGWHYIAKLGSAKASDHPVSRRTCTHPCNPGLRLMLEST